MIVDKVVSYMFCLVQGRRIKCERCGEPFTFVHHEVYVCSDSGTALISKDAKLKRKALAQGSKEIAEIARKVQRGFALCPHCKMYQRWMIAARRKARLVAGAIAGALVGTPIGIAILAYAGELKNYSMMETLLAGFAICGGPLGGLGALASLFFRVGAGPFPEKVDRQSLTDEAFEGLVAKCRAEDVDPVVAWATAVSPEISAHAANSIVALGLLDATGSDLHPELATEGRIQELHARLEQMIEEQV